MSYKTLIIIDNSSMLTTLNQEIIRETVKYYVKNMDKENQVAIAVTGETAEYLTNYGDSTDTQIKAVEKLEFVDTNAPGGDVLMEVLLDWANSDFAYRDILFVSGKGVGVMREYSEEELLFQINGRQYPVYCLSCIQDGNEAMIKSMGMVARVSGGTLISTTDAERDAEVERQLCEKLFSSMSERRSTEETEYYDTREDVVNKNIEGVSKIEGVDITSEPGDVSSGNETKIAGSYEADSYMSDTSEESSQNVIYELSDNGNDVGFGNLLLIIPLIIAVLVFIVRFLLRRSNEKKNENGLAGRSQKYREHERSAGYEPFSAKAGNGNKRMNGSLTAKLGTVASEESDTGTRLLYRSKEGVEITLEDRADPTKFYRACVADSVIIGRNEKLCDIVINYDDSVSQRHCELYSRDKSLYIRDLDSSNGTVVNQHKVYQEIEVESGDILRIGRLTFFIQIVCEGIYE